MRLEILRRNRELKHDEATDQLSGYLDGHLTATEMARLERHIAECTACSEELQALQMTRQLMKSLQPVRAPRSFVLESAPARVTLPWSFFFMRNATGVAAAALAALMLLPSIMPAAGLGAAGARAPERIAATAPAAETGGGAAQPAAAPLASPSGDVVNAPAAQQPLETAPRAPLATPAATQKGSEPTGESPPAMGAQAPAIAAAPAAEPAPAREGAAKAQGEQPAGDTPVSAPALAAGTRSGSQPAPDATPAGGGVDGGEPAPGAAEPAAPFTAPSPGQAEPERAAPASRPGAEQEDTGSAGPQTVQSREVLPAPTEKVEAAPEGVEGTLSPDILVALQGLAAGLVVILGLGTSAIYWKHRRER